MNATTMPPPAVLTLAQYVTACLDPIRAATRASLTVDGCPPSGHGSDTPTVRVVPRTFWLDVRALVLTSASPAAPWYPSY